MSRRVQFAPAAADDLREAVDWYDEQRLGLGNELRLAVADTLRRMAASPGVFPPAPWRAHGSRARWALVEKFPYAIAFVVIEDHIRVLAVAHGSRRPGFWRSRQ